MSARRRRILAACAGALLPLLVLGGLAAAHVRLIHPANERALRWGRPQEVSIVIASAGSDDVLDGSHAPAIRVAIDAWNSVPGAEVHLAENTSAVQRARTDWEADSIHLVLFDEDDSSGYFPPGSGIVAITPIWFGNNGRIADADILFNGADFEFTTSGGPWSFDIGDVAAHELGHLVGLDHSGWASATMYPYVDPATVLHRSLSEDDRHGVVDAYPVGTFATITGTIHRASGDSAVPGAHVVARDGDGRTVASILASSFGVFGLRALAPGTYTLYATPFDQPVAEFNLGGGHSISTDFSSTMLGTWTVAAGEALPVGTRHVDADVPLALGRNADLYPLRAIAGQTRSFQVRGSGLLPGCTLTAADPTLTVTPTVWLGTQVNFLVATPLEAPDGHVDLMVVNPAGHRSILTGALEITPRDPLVDRVTPALATASGGTRISIEGSRFRAGARVVIGESLYTDGAADGCTVSSDDTIELTLRPTPSGSHDVVVIDPTGVEGRLEGGLDVALVPVIATVFPPSGSAGGGTQLVLTGADFEAGCTVTIDGVPQAQTTRESATTLRVTTQAYVPGGPYLLEVANPSGPTATAAFAYVPTPDPVITAVDPPSGPAAGGGEIVLHGANFLSSTEVVFGADAETGTGGTPAPMVELLDGGTLRVVTPSHASGMHSVLVRDEFSGQAAVLPAAFMFTSSGGGGGGCSIAPAHGGGGDGTARAADAVTWIAGLALMLALLHARTRALRTARAEPAAAWYARAGPARDGHALRRSRDWRR